MDTETRDILVKAKENLIKDLEAVRWGGWSELIRVTNQHRLGLVMVEKYNAATRQGNNVYPCVDEHTYRVYLREELEFTSESLDTVLKPWPGY
jgi:hypothetical protein